MLYYNDFNLNYKDNYNFSNNNDNVRDANDDKSIIYDSLSQSNSFDKDIQVDNLVNSNIDSKENNSTIINETLKRASIPKLDEILGIQFKILDHGFIRVIDYMGSDSSITQAARVSYGVGTKQVSEDIGLINYLMKHKHTTPFEMCEIKFHIKMPIFVARQWIRHRTANVNEYSARYSFMKDDYYVPNSNNVAEQSKTNKQGRNPNSKLTHEARFEVIQEIEEISKKSYDAYINMLNTNINGEILDELKPNISRELARVVLGVNYYTEMYWKIDLHNLFHFLHLRSDSHAQYEIRVYAEKMLEIVKIWVPIAYDAFIKYRMNAITLSPQMMLVLKGLLRGESITQESSGLSKREYGEVLGLIAK